LDLDPNPVFQVDPDRYGSGSELGSRVLMMSKNEERKKYSRKFFKFFDQKIAIYLSLGPQKRTSST
jgi:hypothetical protein